MAGIGLEQRITRLLSAGNAEGGFPMALVCTEQGLLVAASGDLSPCEDLAALASLFDDVVSRMRRDMEMTAIDELAVRDGRVGRFVIRPLVLRTHERMFLVVHVPPALTWRRTTNRLCVALLAELDQLCVNESGGPDDA
ncbi:MAG: hypothetical protein Q8P41_28885 [Pseudomonadota bacterium]|nr:hypothetical protein [Pseudomonadota bacterium]